MPGKPYFQNVDLIDGGNLNHTECAGPAILAAKIWIDELAELCQPTSLEDTSNRIKKDVIGTIDFLGRLIPDNTYNKNKISIYSNGSYQKEMILK